TSRMERFFATCARGLEHVLADELRALDAHNVEPGRGGTAFEGDTALLYRANLWLRTGIRVLKPILEADVVSPDDLYAAVPGPDSDAAPHPGPRCKRARIPPPPPARPPSRSQGRHLRSVGGARRPAPQRGWGGADDRPEPAHLPRPCRFESG